MDNCSSASLCFRKTLKFLNCELSEGIIMGKGKKPFIDRKSALTFHLVHRSQHDPLITDETAPQHVLVESITHKQLQKQSTENDADSGKRLDEQRKYGIQFDDDYNYLQHLKKPEQEIVWEYVENPNQTRKRVDENQIASAIKLNLPSSVFASEFEEGEGMLTKAAVQPGPRPDWDPDVVAALDEDFDFENAENQLEDDFVVQAMGDSLDDFSNDDNAANEEIESDFSNFDSDNESEIMDRLAPLMREGRIADDNKSRFTEYSMSSSVIRRNEQLTLLDDRFERLYASYDDPELGDLALENIEGTWQQKHPYVLGCFKKFKNSSEKEDYNKAWDKERLKNYCEAAERHEQDPNDELMVYEVEDTKDKKWDCESILSTYSNVYNRPKLIDEPRQQNRSSFSDASSTGIKIEIDPKTGLPLNVLRGGNSNNLTTKALAELNTAYSANNAGGTKSLCAKSVVSTLSVLSIRPKNETPEDKRERKRLLKEYRSERRIEKKANVEAFKVEKKRQTHVQLNKHLNQTGNKIL